MTHKNVRICNCGDCDAAIDRALALCKQMFNDNECAVFQTAVCAALSGFIIEETQITTTDLLLHQGLPYTVAREAAFQCVKSIMEPTETKIIERFDERKEEIIKELVGVYMAARKRGSADHEAIRTDSAEIKGGPKPT